MKDELTLEERERYTVIRSCIDGDITNAVAAARLGLKIRRVQKLKRAVETHGEGGVVHGNRSRVPWNATPERTKKAIAAFLKEREHRDFGPTFAMEQLKKQQSIVLSRETVRTIMIRHNLWREKKRTGPALHRAWRERKPMHGGRYLKVYNSGMATVQRFEELIAWKKGRELAREMYKAFRSCRDSGFADQIQRASVSIVSNIAAPLHSGRIL